MADGKVRIDIELVKQKFERQLRELERNTGGAANTIKNFGDKTGKYLAKGAKYAAAGIGFLGGIGLKFNSDMENYTANFRVMLGSQEKAVKKVNQLKKMAAKTPFEVSDLSEATQTLLAFQVPAKKTTKILNQLGDISLGNKEKLKGLSLVFGQVSSAGRLTGQDLLQFINQGFNPLNYIAKRTGESMSELRERMSEGGVTVEEVEQAFEDATSKGGQFYKGMEEGSKTFSGQLSTLKDNLKELLGNASKPLFDYLSNKGIPRAIGAVDFLNDHIIALTSAVSGLAAAFTVLLFAAKVLPVIVDLVKNFGLFTSFLSANKYLLIAAAIVGLGVALYTASQQSDGFQKLFGKIEEKIGTLVGKIPELTSAIIDFVTEAAAVIAEKAPQIIPKLFDSLITGLSEGIPRIAQASVDIILALIDGFTENLPMIIDAAVQIITGLIEGITQNIPLLVDAAIQIINGLAQGFVENLPAITAAAVQLITALIDAITQNMELLIGAAVEIVMALLQGLIQAIPILIQAAPQIINGLINAIITALPLLLRAGWQIIKALAGAIIKNLPTIIKSGPRIILSLVKGILSAIGQLVKMGGRFIMSVIKGIGSAVGRLPSYGRKIVSNVIRGAKSGISGMLTIGRNLIEGVWNGISSKVQWVKNKVTNAFDSIKNLVKKIFSIHSPSKWFAWVSEMNMQGLAQGALKYAKLPINAMKKVGSKIKDVSMGITADGIGAAGASGTKVVNIYDERTVNQNFYNKQTSPMEAYKRSAKGFGKGYDFAY